MTTTIGPLPGSPAIRPSHGSSGPPLPPPLSSSSSTSSSSASSTASTVSTAASASVAGAATARAMGYDPASAEPDFTHGPRALPLTEEQSLSLARVQEGLRAGWTVHMTPDGRFYYCNHVTQTSGWLPPSDSWDSPPGSTLNLPYGWEAAKDKEGLTYYVNHLNKTTTYEDPRKWGTVEPEEVPEPRSVALDRDADMGFGFVAGSEKPVIVRFVTSGGPSVNKLMPGDQILAIDGEDVKGAPRDHVINLVRNCRDRVTLVVCQPPLDNSSCRKSALLSAAKKAKLKSNPSRVRFAESIDISNGDGDGGGNGAGDAASSGSGKGHDSVQTLMPNVLKVFLENGQTKSFKYDSSTTVQDVIDSLVAKLGIRDSAHFSLVVEHIKSLKRNKLTILDPRERLAVIASRPGAHNLRCLFRVTFVPVDAYELLRSDPMSFEYLYVQCCNDVVHERFAPELKYEIALRLAALHIHQHVVSAAAAAAQTANGSAAAASQISPAKVTVKAVEKESGLERFVPASLAETMKKKELRKLLSHFLKLNATAAADPETKPPQQQMTALQAKLHYLKIISDLPSYGAKCFSTNISDSNIETVILISPKFGISQINSLRNSVPLNLCDIEEVVSVLVSKEDEISQKVDIELRDPEKENIVLSLEDRDAEELVLVLSGYHRLLAGARGQEELNVVRQKSEFNAGREISPPYCSKHQVLAEGWNYPASPLRLPHTDRAAPAGVPVPPSTSEYFVDLGGHPPYHTPPDGFRMPLVQQQGCPSAAMPPFNSDSGSDADSSMTTSSSNTTTAASSGGSAVNEMGDRNRNFTLEDNANYASSNSSNSPKMPFSTFSPIAANNNNSPARKPQMPPQMNANGGAGMVRKPPRAPPSSATSTPKRMDQQRSSEARNDAVIRRVAEMKQLVADAESYLHVGGEHGDTGSVSSGNSGNGGGNGVNNTDTESVTSATARSEVGSDVSSSNGGGRLKHSDSLLLLNQDPNDVDSSSTSTTSVAEAVNLIIPESAGREIQISGKAHPAHDGQLGRLKQSDSSFGLHSPDNLGPLGFHQHQEVGGGGQGGGGGQVQELLKKLKATPNGGARALPPLGGPHHHRHFQEGSLVLDRDLIDLTMIPPPMTPDEEGLSRMAFPGTLPLTATTSVSTPPTPFADRETLEAELRALESEVGDIETLKGIATWRPGDRAGMGDSSSPGGLLLPGLAAVYQLKDLDSFIANTAVPPPPPSLNAKAASSSVRQEESQMSDLSAFIIPPPPSTPAKRKQQQQQQQQQEQAMESGKAVSPLIASIQQKLMSPTDENGKAKEFVLPVRAKPTAVKRKDPSPPPPPPPRTSFPPSSRPPHSSYQFGSEQENGRQRAPPTKLPLKLSESSSTPPNSPYKLSVTSSSDSISSSGTTDTSSNSVNTVKSVSPDYADEDDNSSEGPPSLPPRLSPVKTPQPPPTSNGSAIDTTVRSKSIVDVNGGSPASKKPAIPSRATKPTLSTSERTPKKTVVKISKEVNGDAGPPPQLPQKTLVAGRKLPLPPPPPKMSNGHPRLGTPGAPLRINQPNGVAMPRVNGTTNGHSATAAEPELYSNSEFDPDDEYDCNSLEGTSVDDDDDMVTNGESVNGDHAEVFRRAGEVIERVVAHIDGSRDICNTESKSRSPKVYSVAKERLTTESRHFVTASKLFVKSATENGEGRAKLLECLSHCVQMVDRIGQVTRDLSENTDNPSATFELVEKVRDVAETYLLTVRAAGDAIGKKMNDPTMSVLMKRATTLAGVLTTLMRSLRVFN